MLDHGRTFLPIVGALYFLAIVSYFFVWIVDPFNFRPWGATAKLADHPYIDRVVPFLFSVAARDGTDLVIVGGSTSVNYSTAMLREAFPDAARPVNLSFFSLRARDYKMAFDRLEKSHSLKRVVIGLEWPFIKDYSGIGYTRDSRHYTNLWYDPVPEFNMETIQLSARVLATGVMDMPAWKRIDPRRPDEWYLAQPLTASPDKMEKLREAAEVSRNWVTGAPPVSCDAMQYLSTVLLPFVERMSARGVFIDLLLPPYSLALYSDWSANDPYDKIFPEHGAPFANLVSMRRCVVEMTSKIKNVHVHAFDNDSVITGDLSRYMDTGHILDLETSRQILLRVAKGDAVLTVDRWSEFENSLRNLVNKLKP